MITKNSKNENSIRFIQSVKRAMSIMEVIAKNKNLAGITTISRYMGLSKSTIYGLVSTLEQMGYLQQNGQNGEYSLGIKLFELGQIVYSSMDLRTIAKPFLRQLVDQHQETVHLAVLSKGDVIYIDKVSGNQSIGIISQIGGRNPAYCTGVGKVLLADMPVEQLDKMFKTIEFHKLTKKTIIDPELLKDHLVQVKGNGYAMDVEEIEIGLVCVAAPIKNHSGKVVAAISLSGPVSRMEKEKLFNIQKDVVATSQKISRQLGYNFK